MAESQGTYKYDTLRADLIHEALSAERMKTYIERAGGDKARALELYLYNARLAKSLLFPLGAVEVSVRNAVDKVLYSRYGEWHTNADFIENVLMKRGKNTLSRAIERAKTKQRGQVIATLTFDFWSNIFRQEYSSLWRVDIGKAFPHIEPGLGRSDIQPLVARINRLRNRVAHYEPVLSENIPEELATIQQVLSYRCPELLEWVKKHTTSNSILRTYPKRTLLVDLASRTADRVFYRVALSDTLDKIAQLIAGKPAAMVVMDGSLPVAVITPSQMADYLLTMAVNDSGMIELSDHTIDAVCNHTSAAQSTTILPDTSAMAQAIERLKSPKIAALLLTSPEGDAESVIMRAHRRY